MKPPAALVILAAVLMTSLAEAGSPGTPVDADAVFFSEKVLQGALSDIARMSDAELRAFTRYLSECDRSDSNGVEYHACGAAYISYRIEFGATHPGETRPLDDLLAARDVRASKVGMGLEKGPVDFDEFAKQAVILSKLEDGARARFHALRAGEK